MINPKHSDESSRSRTISILELIVQRCGSAAVVHPSETVSRSMNIRGEPFPAAPLLRPANTEEVAFMVSLARAEGKSLITVGGTTGLVDGLKPARGDEWYLSLERMRKIERIDAKSRIAVVEAGVVLHTLHAAALECGLQFAIDLGARGSATIGGLISTNAGGERVLKYGMMREQILGLEVVTADGAVLDLMAEVLKNNAGYDLKHIFVGAEGTLGIVTRAVLKLRPAPSHYDSAILAVNLSALSATLSKLEAQMAGTLSACEIMWPEFWAIMTDGDGAPHRSPLQTTGEAYLLVEGENYADHSRSGRLSSILEAMLSSEMILDAVIAKSEADRTRFWNMRNDIARLVRCLSPLNAFDVSLPIPRMADYVDELRSRVVDRWPDARLVVFGHVADNNLHVLVSVREQSASHAKDLAEIVYRGVVERRGSISAEHGIGIEKKISLEQHTPSPVLDLMKHLKGLLDPHSMFNPGKVV